MGKRLPFSWLLAGGLALLLVLSTCGSRRALDARDARVDSLRTETLTARAAAMGWETRLASATEDLELRLQELGDSTALLAREKAELAREVEELGGRLATMVDLYASLAGTIETHDAVVHSSDSAHTGESVYSPVNKVDSVTAAIDDGLLSGRMAFVPPSTLDLDYSVRLALALGIIEAADGRLLATARAEDPRVALTFGEVYWSPPAPVNYCGIMTRIGWGLGGAGIGFGAGLTLGGLP
jgi:hypothetical protein